MKKMFKKFQRIVSLALVATFLVSAPCVKVSAMEQSSYVDETVQELESQVITVPEDFFDDLQQTRAVLSDCTIIVGFSSEGMKVEIFTGTSNLCPVVGIKDIRIEKKVWYGWKLVATASGVEDTDTDGIGCNFLYENAIKDETYRVTCVHYADLTYDDEVVYTEGESNTGAFVFTY